MLRIDRKTVDEKKKVAHLILENIFGTGNDDVFCFVFFNVRPDATGH